MTAVELADRLADGGTVPLSAEEWEAMAEAFPVQERHGTHLAGDLLIVKVGERLAAVEAPSKGARVARLLGGPDDAEAFVAKRMDEYERMWDGCGVKVDYFGDS